MKLICSPGISFFSSAKHHQNSLIVRPKVRSISSPARIFSRQIYFALKKASSVSHSNRISVVCLIVNCLLLHARSLIFCCKVTIHIPDILMFMLQINNARDTERFIAKKTITLLLVEVNGTM